MESSFQDRLVLVTGGANGIGRACAEHFAREGARTVVILDNEEQPLAETVEALRSEHPGCNIVSKVLDLTNENSVVSTFAALRSDLGPVDILVNNVGQTARERVSDFCTSEPSTWEFVIRVSLMTTLLCSRQVVNDMRDRRWGKIVNMSSDAPIAGDANISDYSAAKFGVVGFTRSLAREMGPFGVNVNAVAPGVTNTRGPRRMAGDSLAKALAMVPMGSMCEPEDIANAVGFLASDKARYVTGHVLVVNGGRAFH